MCPTHSPVHRDCSAQTTWHAPLARSRTFGRDASPHLVGQLQHLPQDLFSFLQHIVLLEQHSALEIVPAATSSPQRRRKAPDKLSLEAWVHVLTGDNRAVVFALLPIPRLIYAAEMAASSPQCLCLPHFDPRGPLGAERSVLLGIVDGPWRPSHARHRFDLF